MEAQLGIPNIQHQNNKTQNKQQWIDTMVREKLCILVKLDCINQIPLFEIS